MTIAKLWMLSGAVVGTILGQPTLRITSPADGTVVHPGQSLKVKVEALGTFQQVVITGHGSMTAPLLAPPYDFTIEIPSRGTPGPYPLTAGGFTAPGQGTFSIPVTLQVEEPDNAPIRLEPEFHFLELNVGDKGHVTADGVFPDGRRFGLSESAQISFRSSAPEVATVDRQGVVTAVAPGSAQIIATYRSLSAEAASVTVAPLMSIVPVRTALHPSQTQHFFSRLADYSTPPFVWSIKPPGVGRVSAAGDYTAPSSIASSQNVLLTATAASNHAISATSTITLLPLQPLPAKPSCDTAREQLKRGDLMAMIDMVPDLLLDSSVITDSGILATSGRPVTGIAADGNSIALLRFRANFVGERLEITSLSDEGNASGLAEIPDTGSGSSLPFESLRNLPFGPGPRTVSAVASSVGPIAFAYYRAPDSPAFGGVWFRIQSLDLPCFAFSWPGAH
jgi:hypothetical protein